VAGLDILYANTGERTMPEMKVPTPPSAPTMNVGGKVPELLPETPLTLEPDPVNPEPEDITDPEVPDTLKTALEIASSHQGTTSPQAYTHTPPTEQEAPAPSYDALLFGFCSKLLTRMQGIADDITTTTQQKVVEHMHNYHAVSMGVQEEVCKAVKAWIEATTAKPNEHALYSFSHTLEKGIQLRGDPYAVDIEALAPQGYVCRFRITKQEAGELVTEIGNIMSWLTSQGYKPVG
jgi:hypothetical protein